MITLQRATGGEFDKIALSHPKGNFHQIAAMITLRESMGWDVHPLLVRDDEKVIGALLLAGKGRRYQITMGPLFDFSNSLVGELLAGVREYAKSQGAAILDIYPNELLKIRDSSGKVLQDYSDKGIVELFTKLGWKHKGFTIDYDMAANRWMFTKDLSGMAGEEDLLKSYRQTTRQIVRKFNERECSVEKLGYDDLEVAKSLIDSSNEKNAVVARPLEYYQKLYKAFGEAVEFLVVYHENKTPISTGIFIRHPNEMVYFMSGADGRYRHLYGGHYLQHYMMKRCVSEGIARYNFYWVTGHFTNNPLLVYKAGFRGVVEEYVGGFYAVLNPVAASMMLIRGALGKLRRKLLR